MRTNSLMAALCAAVALAAGVAAGAGVVLRGSGATTTVTSVRGETYEMATDGVYAFNAMRVVAEGIGWDVFTLLVAVPALLLTSIWVARRSFRGRLVAAGLLGYFVYMYLEYAVTWAFGPLFPLFIAIYSASLVGIVWIGADLAAEGLTDRFGQTFPRRSWAALSLGMALLLTVLWTERIVRALAGPVTLHGETTMTIQALDLGLMVPATALIAAIALRRHPAGLAAAAAFVVTFTGMCAAIGSMLISAWLVTGVLEMLPIVIFGLAAIGGLAIGLRMYAAVRPVDSPLVATTVRFETLAPSGTLEAPR
jgi:hypothetical protein